MRPSDLLIRLIDPFYRGPLRRLMPRETFRYGVCGALNMGLDLVLYFLVLHEWVRDRFIDLGIVVVSPPIAALCIVFPVTFLFGFWLNRNVAFRRSPLAGGVQLTRYALSVGGALLLTYVVMKLLVEYAHVWPTPAKAITTVVTTAYSYLSAKHFTFRGCERPR